MKDEELADRMPATDEELQMVVRERDEALYAARNWETAWDKACVERDAARARIADLEAALQYVLAQTTPNEDGPFVDAIGALWNIKVRARAALATPKGAL